MSDPGQSGKRPADHSVSDDETTPTKKKFVPDTPIFGPWDFRGNLPSVYFRGPLNSPDVEFEDIESEDSESESDQSDVEIETLDCESEQPDCEIQIFESESEHPDDERENLEIEADQPIDESFKLFGNTYYGAEVRSSTPPLKAIEHYSPEPKDWVKILGSENTEPLPEKEEDWEYLQTRKRLIANQMSSIEFVPTVVAFWALHPLDRRYQKARARREKEKEERFKASYCSLVRILTLVRGTRMPGQCLRSRSYKSLVMKVILDYIKYYIQSLLYNFKSNGITCEGIVSCYYAYVGYVTIPRCNAVNVNNQANEYSTWTEAQKMMAAEVIKNLIEVVEEIRCLLVRHDISIDELHDKAHNVLFNWTYNPKQILYQNKLPSLPELINEAIKQGLKNSVVLYIDAYSEAITNFDRLQIKPKAEDDCSAAVASELALQRRLNQLSAEYDTSLVEAQRKTPVRKRLPWQELNIDFLEKRKTFLANYLKEPHMLPVVLDFWALHPFYRKCPMEEYVLAEEDKKLQIHRYLRHILLVCPEPAPREDQYPIPNKEMMEGKFEYAVRGIFNRELVMKIINEHIRHVLREMMESWSARYEEVIYCYELAWDVCLPRQYSCVTYDQPTLPLQRFSPYTTDEIEKTGNGLTKIGVFLRKCFDYYDIDVAEFHEMVDQLPRDYQFELDEDFEIIEMSEMPEHVSVPAFKQVNLLMYEFMDQQHDDSEHDVLKID